MSGERPRDSHDGERPASTAKSPTALEATAVTGLPGLFETHLGRTQAQPCPRGMERGRDRLHRNAACADGQNTKPGGIARGGGCSGYYLLILHFPEGPKLAEKAQRELYQWLQNLDGEPRPAAARWQAAMREIRALERDPAEPNYLTHIDGLHGVDFSGIGRGLNLRSRRTAREQTKIWAALSWRNTPDGGYLLSRNNRPMARLVRNRDEQFGDGWLNLIENRFGKLERSCDAVDFRTRREGKAFLERWEMGISEREFRRCGGRRRDNGLER
jgi:hypothetical protein